MNSSKLAWNLLIGLLILIQLILLDSKVKGQAQNQIPPIFFDAKETSITSSSKDQIFKGDVVAVVSGTIVTADKIKFDDTKKTITAEGHALIIMGNQLLGGDKFIYHIDNQNFFIEHAFLITNNKTRTDKIFEKILGYTPENFTFEVERKKRQEEINNKIKKLKDDYDFNSSQNYDDTVTKLSRFLEQIDMIREQDNISLRKIDIERRNRIKKRREYWQKAFNHSQLKPNSLITKGYIQLNGDRIQRTQGNRYEAVNSNISPCFCEDDENPAWSLESKKLVAYSEGYADLFGAVVKIKGIPVLYLPYIKLPIKSKRQSGFLMPSLGYNRLNGSILSQSIFFDFGKDKDSTLSFDLIQRRGLLFGLEGRYKPRSNSSWTVKFEALRDKKWLYDRSQRQGLFDAYSNGLKQAKSENSNEPTTANMPFSEYNHELLSDPQYWKDSGLSHCLEEEDFESCVNQIQQDLQAPDRRWRHLIKWQGHSHLSRHISFVSTGSLLSDHRYTQDTNYEQLNDQLQQTHPKLFSTSHFMLHTSSDLFYLGIGSSWGDPMKREQKLSGHQLPLLIKAKSKLFNITEYPFPIYWQLGFTHKKIQLMNEVKLEARTDLSTQTKVVLDSGSWSQFKVDWVSPLTQQQMFDLEHFGEIELRAIDTNHLFSNNNFSSNDENIITARSGYDTIRSGKFGFSLNIPIEGIQKFEDKKFNVNEKERFFNHKMDWKITLSFRPSVLRQGLYGTAFSSYNLDENTDTWSAKKNATPLSYFESDNSKYFYDQFTPEEDQMTPHQKIIFSTAHSWQLFSRAWSQISEKQVEETEKILPEKNSPYYYEELAKQQLEEFIAHQKIVNIINNEAQAYAMGFMPTITDKNNFLNFSARISFDFKKEKEREKLKNMDTSTNELPKSWSPFYTYTNLKIYSWSLINSNKFDIYEHLFRETHFSLVLPSLLKTQVTIGYTIENETTFEDEDNLTFNRITTKRLTIHSNILTRMAILAGYALKNSPHLSNPSQKYARVGLIYTPLSKCWGLSFTWNKNYGDEDWLGTYFMALNINLFNNRRNYGNLLSKVNQ